MPKAIAFILTWLAMIVICTGGGLLIGLLIGHPGDCAMLGTVLGLLSPLSMFAGDK